MSYNKPKKIRIRNTMAIIITIIVSRLVSEFTIVAVMDAERLLKQVEGLTMMAVDAGSWGTNEGNIWTATCGVMSALDTIKNSDSDTPSLSALETANDALDGLIN